MIRCMIVDDEPLARELIASYIKRLDGLELVDQCENALEAFASLQRQRVDLLFLDIQMPKLTGLELIRSLQSPPRVVFITAYKEYAADGFDLDVLDYLVKPVSFERFMRSIARYHRFIPGQDQEEPLPDAYDQAYLFIKVNKEQVKVFFKDILYIESLKDYIRMVSTGASHLTYSRLSYMEELLPESRFARIHKSYIVSLARISSYGSDFVRLGKTELPLGRTYKQGFMEAMSRFQAEIGA